MSTSKLLLKRDESSINPPAPEQVDVGELVINSVTGKLYTKLSNGDLIEYIGQKVCFNSVPTVSFNYEGDDTVDLINKFCCAGAMLTVIVSKLRPSPSEYSFSIVELTNNTTQDKIIVNTPEYEIYNDNGVSYRRANIPASISVNPSSYTNISIFKFNIFLDSIKISETLLTIQCLEAQT